MKIEGRIQQKLIQQLVNCYVNSVLFLLRLFTANKTYLGDKAKQQSVKFKKGILMRAKIKVSFESEYEIVPKYYPENSSYEEMLNIDIKQIDDDPFIFLEGLENDDNWVVTGELINDVTTN